MLFGVVLCDWLMFLMECLVLRFVPFLYSPRLSIFSCSLFPVFFFCFNPPPQLIFLFLPIFYLYVYSYLLPAFFPLSSSIYICSSSYLFPFSISYPSSFSFMCSYSSFCNPPHPPLFFLYLFRFHTLLLLSTYLIFLRLT